MRAAVEWKRLLRRAGRDRRAQKLLLAAAAFLLLLALEVINIVRQPWALVLLVLGGGTGRVAPAKVPAR